MTRPFLIDTDTASDDAIALIMALRADKIGIDIDVKAITVVAGNMPIDQGVQNALFCAELCGSEVPVYRGAEKPLLREIVFAYWFHGNDGLSDKGFAPTRRTQPTPGNGVDVLIETIKANPGITIVTLGPLTNIALAVAHAPEIVSMVDRLVMMGGAAATSGNVTPAAEYNIWVDPEAARMVFHSGLPVEMVGWELCRGEAGLSPDERAAILAFDNPIAHFAMESNIRATQAAFEQSGETGLTLPDPVAMAIALDPSICPQRTPHFVDVETVSDLTRGMTVVDRFGVSLDERNQREWGAITGRGHKAAICWSLDIPRWKSMLSDLLR